MQWATEGITQGIVHYKWLYTQISHNVYNEAACCDNNNNIQFLEKHTIKIVYACEK